MNFDFITGASVRELEQFKAICNQLLSRTYLYAPSFSQVKDEWIIRIIYFSPDILRRYRTI